MTLDYIKTQISYRPGGKLQLGDSVLTGLGGLFQEHLKLSGPSLEVDKLSGEESALHTYSVQGNASFLGFQNVQVKLLFAEAGAVGLTGKDIVFILSVDFLTLSDLLTRSTKFKVLRSSRSDVIAVNPARLILCSQDQAKPWGQPLPKGLSVMGILNLAGTFGNATDAGKLFHVLDQAATLSMVGPVGWKDAAHPTLKLAASGLEPGKYGTLALLSKSAAVGVELGYEVSAYDSNPQTNVLPTARLFFSAKLRKNLEVTAEIPLPPKPDHGPVQSWKPYAIGLAAANPNPDGSIVDFSSFLDVLGATESVKNLGFGLGQQSFGLKSVGIVLPIPAGAPMAAQMTMGLTKGPWQPLDKVPSFTIPQLSLSVAVVNPLSTPRSWTMSLRSTVSWKGHPFYIEAYWPGFNIHGEYKDATSIDFKALAELLDGQASQLPVLQSGKKNDDLTFYDVTLDVSPKNKSLAIGVTVETSSFELFGKSFALQGVRMDLQIKPGVQFNFSGVVVLANELWWLNGLYDTSDASNKGFTLSGALSAPTPLPPLQLVGRLTERGGATPGWLPADPWIDALTVSLDTRPKNKAFSIEGDLAFGDPEQPGRQLDLDLGFTKLTAVQLRFKLATAAPQQLPGSAQAGQLTSGGAQNPRKGKYRGYLLLEATFGRSPVYTLDLGYVFQETNLLIGRLTCGDKVDPLEVAKALNFSNLPDLQALTQPAQQAVQDKQKASNSRYELDAFLDLDGRKLFATLQWQNEGQAYLYAEAGKEGKPGGFQFGLVADEALIEAIFKAASLSIGDLGFTLEKIAVVVSTLGSDPWSSGASPDQAEVPAPLRAPLKIGQQAGLRKGVNFFASLTFPTDGLYGKTDQHVTPLSGGELQAFGFIGQQNKMWAAGLFVALQVQQIKIPFGSKKQLGDYIENLQAQFGVKLTEGATPPLTLVLRVSFDLPSSKWMDSQRAAKGEWAQNLHIVGELDIDELGVMASASAAGTWQDAFGIPGLDLTNLAFVLGFAWEDELPTVGFTGLLDCGSLQGFLAVLFNSENPSESLFAGSVSDLSLGQIATALLGTTAVPPELSGVLDRMLSIQGVAIGTSAIGPQDKATLDARRLPSSIAESMKKLGHKLPAVAQVSVHVSEAGKTWFLFDHSNVNGYTITTDSQNFQLEWQAGIYIAPGQQPTKIGQFTFQPGIRMDGRIRILDIVDVFAIVQASQAPTPGIAVLIEFPEALKLFDKLLLSRPEDGFVRNLTPPVPAGTADKYAGKADVTTSKVLDNLPIPVALDASAKGPVFSCATYDKAFGANAPPELAVPHVLLASRVQFLGLDSSLFVYISTRGFELDLEFKLFDVSKATMKCHAGNDGFQGSCDVRVGITGLDLGEPQVGNTSLWTSGDIQKKSDGADPDCVSTDLGIRLSYNKQGGEFTASAHATVELFGLDIDLDLDLSVDASFFETIEDTLKTALQTALGEYFGKTLAGVASWLTAVAGDYIKYGGPAKQGQILLAYAKEGTVAVEQIGALCHFMGLTFQEIKDLLTDDPLALRKDVEAQFGLHVNQVGLLQRGGPVTALKDHEIATVESWFDTYIGTQLDSKTTALSAFYDGDRQWLALLQAQFLEFISIDAMLFDPADYGMRLRVSLGAFNLDVEVDYHRIRDDLGVFTIETAQAHQQYGLGPLSFALPSLRISIYTNGNFELDAGYPQGDDWSRAMSLSVLSSTGASPRGAGGFYVAELGNATSHGLSGDVVVAAGVAVRFGLEDTFSIGVLSGGYKVGFVGRLQGALGFGAEGGALTQLEPISFRIDGHLTISGSLWGKVDFGVVKASIAVAIAAGIGFLIDSAKGDIKLSFECHIQARASLDVDCGLFTVHLHFSFSRDFHFSLTLHLPAPPQQNRRFAAAHQNLARLRTAPGDFGLAPRALDTQAPSPAPEMSLEDAAAQLGQQGFLSDFNHAMAVIFYPEWSVIFDRNGNGTLQLIGAFGVDSNIFSTLVGYLMHLVLTMRQKSYLAGDKVPYATLEALRDDLDHDLWNWLGAEPGGVDLGKRIRGNLLPYTNWSYRAFRPESPDLYWFPPDPNLKMVWGHFEGDRQVSGGTADFSSISWLSREDYESLCGFFAQQLGEPAPSLDPWGDGGGYERPTFASIVYSSYCEFLIRNGIRLVIGKLKPEDSCNLDTIKNMIKNMEFSAIGEQASLYFRHGLRMQPGDRAFYSLLGSQFAYDAGEILSSPTYLFGLGQSDHAASSSTESTPWRKKSAPYDYPLDFDSQFYDLKGDNALATKFQQIASGKLKAPETGIERLALQPAAVRHPVRFGLPKFATWYASPGAQEPSWLLDASAVQRVAVQGGTLSVTLKQRPLDQPIPIGLAAPPDPHIEPLPNTTSAAWGCRLPLRLRRLPSGSATVFAVVGVPAQRLTDLAAVRAAIAAGETLTLQVLRPASQGELKGNSKLAGALVCHPAEKAFALRLGPAADVDRNRNVAVAAGVDQIADFLAIVHTASLQSRTTAVVSFGTTLGSEVFQGQSLGEVELVLTRQAGAGSQAFSIPGWVNTLSLGNLTADPDTTVVFAEDQDVSHGFWESVAHPGERTLGFRREAPALSNDNQSLLDNAYSILAVTATWPQQSGVGEPITLRPVGPQCKSDSDPDKGWYYRVTVPIGPAWMVGKDLAIDAAMHDFYGNVLEPSRQKLSVPLLHREPLLSAAQWPAVGLSYRFGSAGVWSIEAVLTPLEAIQQQLATDAKARGEAAQLLTLANDQMLRDARVHLSVSLDTPHWDAARRQVRTNGIDQESDPGALQTFVLAMSQWVDGSAQSGPPPLVLSWRHTDMPALPAVPAPLRVWLAIERVQFVDDEAATQIPEVRSVAVELPSPPATAATNAAFERAFPGLTLGKAKAPGEPSGLWGVPKSFLDFTPADGGMPVYFAAEPISNVLESGAAWLPAGLGTANPSWTGASQHLYSNVDPALLARELFETVDATLTPETSTTAYGLDATATAALLADRDRIAALFAGRQLGLLFDEQATKGDPEAARQLFTDLLERSLEAAYDVDVLVQVELAWKGLALPAHPTFRLHGIVTSLQETGFRPTAAAVTLRQKGNEVRGWLTFAFQDPSDVHTQNRGGDEQDFQEKLQFEASHLEVVPADGTDPVWIQLVQPAGQPKRLAPDDFYLPIVRRLYPIPPALVSQSWQPKVAIDDVIRKKIPQPAFADLLDWTYQFRLEVNDTAQDEVRIAFDLGGGQQSGRQDVVPDDQTDAVPIVAALARAHFGLQALRDDGSLAALTSLGPGTPAAQNTKAGAALRGLATLLGYVASNTTWQAGKPVPAPPDVQDAYKLWTTGDGQNLSVMLAPLVPTKEQAQVVAVSPMVGDKILATSTLRQDGVSWLQVAKYSLGTEANWRRRQIARTDLDILANDRLAARVHLVRNADLLPEALKLKTRSAYLFSTPPTGFAKPVTPGLDAHALIYDVADLGVSNTGTTASGWTQRLLGLIFQLGNGQSQRIRIETRYGYEALAGQAESVVTVPVAMSLLPEEPFAPADAAKLAQSLGEGIDSWRKGAHSLRPDGFLEFEIVVFGKEGAGTILFRSPRIRVSLSQISF